MLATEYFTGKGWTIAWWEKLHQVQTSILKIFIL
jgi:hypothetical protein